MIQRMEPVLVLHLVHLHPLPLVKNINGLSKETCQDLSRLFGVSGKHVPWSPAFTSALLRHTSVQRRMASSPWNRQRPACEVQEELQGN